MNVLWVVAHPEPRSLTGVLAADGRAALEEQGHAVRVSDLYAMGWNPVVTGDDYRHPPDERLRVGEASQRAYRAGELPHDVVAEQEKLRWADALVLHFPLWWFGVPAILKGWVDRVFVEGFAYGVRGDDGRTRRYGDGVLAGTRALVVTSAGGPSPVFGPRGINGHVDDLLFPLLHGTLFYAGAQVLPPLLLAGADRFTDADADRARAELRERLAQIGTATPLAYRPQRGGDYDERLVLLPHLAPGRVGVGVHRGDDVGAARHPSPSAGSSCLLPPRAPLSTG
ncbi:NAD(P)H-dependent oxidoreductase [Pseudonocardia parietis]|uniref:NAD(P)H dehydrogenase (Quinone) n=1 Tax=Pseudonocardia parietis TaxID=570936 RepID=A0ABS4VUG8_9PSEU|nr:NAD(P)H-dependent oxidoreductase [Pseudonocardia parietis]MBP2367573.1 NAD(P)H dehydrogenase (quinone) [Pseudonocardia parietis]